MASHVIGIGECKVSNDPEDTLITYALGSCVAILIHDPVAQVGGLLHYMLPDSKLDVSKAQERPFVFADTGIPMLFQAAYKAGAVKSRLVVVAAGAAQMLEVNSSFEIGKRNHLAMRKILWKAGVMVQREEIGGNSSRTVRLEVACGRILMRVAGAAEQTVPVKTQRTGAGNGL
jgi:chemotaxis protein CheD